MAQSFCTQCGASIAEGQKFCTSCGSPVLAEDAFEQAGSQAFADQATQFVDPGAAKVENAYADTSGVDRFVSAEPMPAFGASAPAAAPPVNATTQMPPVEPQVQARYVAPVYSEPEEQGGRNQIILAVIAALAIIGLAVALVMWHPWDQGSGSSQQAASSSAASSAQASSASDAGGSPSSAASAAPASSSSSREPTASYASSSSSAADESQLFEMLTAAYDKMGEWDQRIADVAVDFNNTWASSDSATRRANADDAKRLQAEVRTQLSTLQQLSVPSGSKYAQDHQNLIQLQTDLDKRISVIVEAWDNALASSDPKANEKSVLAPLARDNDSEGKNIYKKDFDSLYPNARPGA